MSNPVRRKIPLTSFTPSYTTLNLVPDLVESVNPQKKIKSTVSDWGSFYSNPDFPQPTVVADSFVQILIEEDVCQVRLDFESLDLPETTVFRTSVGGNVIAPLLSGDNTGQHGRRLIASFRRLGKIEI